MSQYGVQKILCSHNITLDLIVLLKISGSGLVVMAQIIRILASDVPTITITF